MDDITFEKLSPTTSADVKVYKEAFDFVFANDDVRNVAVSGAYGAGKSSILESYKRTCDEAEFERGSKSSNKSKARKYIHISLAHFEETQADEQNKVSTSESENGNRKISQEAMLEGKILNQLIHQIPSRKIPQTHFRVKRTVRWWSVVVYSVAVLAFILSLCHILLFNSWQEYLQSLPLRGSWLKATISPYSRLVACAVIALIGGLLIYTIINAQTNKSIFRKLNVNGTEIEIFENSDESYFDKYLNEVLYLFEQADADVIVFEDIDRYGDVQIFERLREINTLVNLQPSRKTGEPLRFFYMIRDDIFKSKDRTKFFDFIIPVVPVVDGSNAFNQFKDHLTENHIFSEFDSAFLQSVARYVDEMRLLKNICNEFLVYFKRITDVVNLNYNKMFAMVIYKNLFPRDFCELQLGRGFVATLFKNKFEFIKERQALLQKQIKDIISLEESVQSEVAKTQEELDTIFKNKISSGYRTHTDWSSHLSAAHKSEYENRSSHIAERKDARMKQLQKERYELEKKLSNLNTSKLSEIIVRENAKSIFSFVSKNEIGVELKFEDVKANPYFNLLKFLIREGYIDETYSDYMTYFYGNSLTSTDKNFLISVTDKEAKEYTYELKSAKLVFENLRVVDFDEEETLNFSLLSYLLIEQRQSQHLKRFIRQLREKKAYDFVYQYYVLNVNNKEFVVVLNEEWPTFFVEMLESPIFTKDVVKSYIINTLYYSNADVVKAVNSESRCLTDYISNDKYFLAIDTPKVDKLIDAFGYLDIEFKELDFSLSDRELFTAVYENNMYEFSYINIALWLRTIFNVTNEIDIAHKNYTLIYERGNSPLLSHVNDNLASYVDLVLKNCNAEICDSEDAACQILNNESLKKEQKEKYIEFLQTEITDITGVKEKAYWSTLVAHKNIYPSWENVFLYYQHTQKVDSELISLINSNNETLFDGVVELFGETLCGLAEKVINCEELDNGKYTTILLKSGFTCDTFDYEDVPEDKVEILIRNHIVNLNLGTLGSFRENYSKLTLEFIRENLGKYFEVVDSNAFSYEEMLKILTWDILDAEKIDLIKMTVEPISIIDREYSDSVAEYILRHNLDVNDMKLLYETYSGQVSLVSRFVFDYAKAHIKDIVSNNMKISTRLRNHILLDSAVESIDKAQIIKHTISECTKDELIKVLQEIGFRKAAEALMDNKQPRIPITEENELLLDAFVAQGWILGYEENASIPSCYRIKRGRRSKKIDAHFL